MCEPERIGTGADAGQREADTLSAIQSLVQEADARLLEKLTELIPNLGPDPYYALAGWMLTGAGFITHRVGRPLHGRSLELHCTSPGPLGEPCQVLILHPGRQPESFISHFAGELLSANLSTGIIVHSTEGNQLLRDTYTRGRHIRVIDVREWARLMIEYDVGLETVGHLRVGKPGRRVFDVWERRSMLSEEQVSSLIRTLAWYIPGFLYDLADGAPVVGDDIEGDLRLVGDLIDICETLHQNEDVGLDIPTWRQQLEKLVRRQSGQQSGEWH